MVSNYLFILIKRKGNGRWEWLSLMRNILKRLKSIEKNCILHNCKEEFGIDYSLLQENFASAVKKTIRFPQDLHDKIVFFQHEFECDSFSEAIIFCLRDYTTNTELARTKYEMKDFFEELILQTYAKTLKEARYESSKYKHLLKYLEEKYGFESEYEQQLLNEIDNKKNHAKY